MKIICPVCQSNAEATAYLTNQTVQLYRCGACRSTVQWPRRDYAELQQIHDNDAYFEHPYFQGRRENAARWDRRAQSIARAMPQFNLSGARHLDIGCDTGGLLKAFQRSYGTQPYGLEISSGAAKALTDAGIPNFCGFLENFTPDAPFDLITATDVIEHVTDPVAFHQAVARCLAPNGIFYYETPNLRSMIYNVGSVLNAAAPKPFAAQIDRLFPPEHVEYYSPEGLRRVAELSGLQLQSCKTKILPAEDLGVSPLLRIILHSMQLTDLPGNQILYVGTMKKR